MLNDIKESREKGKSKSGKSDRNHEKTEKPQNQSKESKETSAQLKAMQKVNFNCLNIWFNFIDKLFNIYVEFLNFFFPENERRC